MRSLGARSRFTVALFALVALSFGLASPRAASAQPFGAWLSLTGGSPSYVEVGHSPALNPTNRLTVEAWVNVADANSGSCSSIVGKNWRQAWWVGICGNSLRSYLKGSSSSRTGGTIASGGVFTHIAVVFTGTRRLHYINGEIAVNVPETGPLTTSTAPLRIGSDVEYEFTPSGSIDDLRIWNTARTQAQIRQSINKDLEGALPGLVAHYKFNGNVLDARGTHHGTIIGSQTGFLNLPAVTNCEPGSSNLCLQGRFTVGTRFRTSAVPGSPFDGFATTPAPSTPISGILAFPNEDLWQMLVNVIDACTAATPHFTVAISSPSTLFTRTEVVDVRNGTSRIYFHWPGPPTAAIQDTASFTSCP